MDCNKDEALRAKEIAEKKMENNDFEGAQKIIVKAQNLYPELENVNQLLSICDVHCSARKSILGSEKDWYGILQVEKLADEVTVKKQYRRLALFLHPDKNRFPGAESAFKLICEANAVLSDPGKKAIYDSRIRIPVRSALSNPPPHHMNKKTQVNKQYGAQNNFSHVFTSVNQHKATQSSSSIRREVFWTSCPFCSMRYQYDREFVNTSVSCQKCHKNFMTYELSAKDIPLGSKWGPPGTQQVPAQHGVNQSAAGIQEKRVPYQGNSKMGVKNDMRSSASHVGSQWKTNNRTVKPEPGIQTENFTQEKRDLRRKSREKGRKRRVESSESYDSSSESDLEDVTIKANFRNATSDLNSGPGYAPRRSSRKRTNVSYNEGDDDDLPSSVKRPQGSELSEDSEHEKKDYLDGENPKIGSQNGFPNADYSNSESKKEMPTVHPEVSLHDKNADADHDKEFKARGQTGRTSDPGADAIKIESDSDQDSYSRDNLDADLCHCDDPEFNDFDKDRDESCFVVNQLWACYDELDGMPRFYAKVKSVRASPFELSITWLEADSTDGAQRQWIDAGLPVGCGSFKHGKTEQTSLRLSFSHQVHFEKGKKRGSLVIYPRVGEVWALFKYWDLSWSHDPENHQEHKYEVVEVLSDFVADAGVKVCYLDKVGGFVSLFQRSSQTFPIGPSELYKFSHRIPCFKMTGSEREGVPVGSFELDPASLPLNPDDLYYPGKAVKETENVGA